MFEPHIPLPVLRRLAAPALIVAGDRDVIRPEHMVAIYRHLRRARLWIVPDCGHATLQDRASELNQQVEAFFQAPAISALPH